MRIYLLPEDALGRKKIADCFQVQIIGLHST